MRRKIWEDTDIQCSIIGTCLSLRELRKIARQAKVCLGGDADEFEVHVTFVRLCCEPGPAAKAVNKALDKKYAGAIRKYAKAANDAALLTLWRESQAKGDIPGPYWALMTHPVATPDLRRRVFGDVHMLSHLVGSSNRADIRRLSEIEDTLQTVQERHAKAKSIYKDRLKHLVGENRNLSRKLAALAKEAETLRQRTRYHCDEVIQCENMGLQRSLSTQAVQLAEERARNANLRRRLAAQDTRLEYLEEELREKRGEVEFLEAELGRIAAQGDAATVRTCAWGCEKAGTPECPGPDLCGKRILYVGGRANLVQHYRDVVERRGGQFVHHDGGVEHPRQALPKLLNGVDAVLCPVDCVSHDACQCVKEVCKHVMKPCMLLRSSGLSSLVRSLEELTAQPPTQRRS